MLIAAVFLLAVVGPSEVYEACRDSGRSYEECGRVDRERLIAEIGAERLDAMTGDAVVRRAIFFTDYLDDMPVVEFRRDPGSPPRVAVSYNYLERGVARLEAPVPLDVWRRVLSEGAHFDRPLGPQPTRPPEAVPSTSQLVRPQQYDDDVVEAVICLHPWNVWAQGYDETQGPREAGGSTCADSLAIDYAYMLADLAIDLLPACAVLDEDRFGGGPRQLAACFALEGDTLAAAAMMNDLEPLNFFDPSRRGNQDAIAERFDSRSDLTVTWAGVTISGPEAAAAQWIERITARGVGVYELTYEGEAWDVVRVHGVIAQPINPDSCLYGPAEAAPLDMLWRDAGWGWLIEEMTVGAFSPLPDGEGC